MQSGMHDKQNMFPQVRGKICEGQGKTLLTLTNAHITTVYYRSMVTCNDTCTVHTPKSETHLVHVTRHTVNGNL